MKNLKKSLVFMLILCMVATFALTACGGGGETSDNSAATGDTIKIGALYPITGNYALLGNESLRGLQLITDEWNANGGIAGKQIELVIADIPDTTVAQTEAERLINKEGVQLLTGAYSSALAHANSDVCARYDVPYFELGGIAADLMEKGYQYLWRTCSDTYNFGDSAAEFLLEGCFPKMGIDPANAKVAIPHEDSNYGTCIAQAETALLTAAGVPEANIKEIPYSSASVDLSTVILDIKSFGPDAILITSYANDSVLFGRQAKELGLELPVLIGAGGGHSLASTYEALGNDMYGVYTADFPQYRMTGGELLDAYLEKYRDKFGEEPLSGHSLTNYNGGQMIFDVLEAAGGSLDKDDIKAATATIDVAVGTYPGGWGCKYKEDGQNGNAPTTVSMWTPSTLDTVWPLDLAMTDFVAPAPTFAEKATMTF